MRLLTFALLPEFAQILGGEKSPKFARFVEICCDAFLILRKNSHVFINLFAMVRRSLPADAPTLTVLQMLSTGIPELKTTDDLHYLRRAFMLDADEAGAVAAFKKLISASLNDSRRRFDNAIHILKHK